MSIPNGGREGQRAGREGHGEVKGYSKRLDMFNSLSKFFFNMLLNSVFST